MTPTHASAQLRGRYLVRNRLVNASLCAADGALRVARQAGLRAPAAGAPATLRRVLVAIGGHVGDAVLATGAIAATRRAFPDVEIGVVASSWNVPVIEGHPDVARIHVVDHWRGNRTLAGFWRRWHRYRQTFRIAAREIAAAGYDAAVDTYPYFPNAAVLLWRAGVPWRVGFESGGFGELHSRALPWRPVHASVLHRDVVATLAEDVGHGSVRAGEEPPAYDLPPVAAAHSSAVARRLASRGARPGYIVAHVGAGAPAKTWPAHKWRHLLQGLAAAGRQVVLTGAGAREAAVAAEASAGIDCCIDTVGELAWGEFVAIVSGAALCIAPDTAAAHVAAATGTPVVVLWNGINDPAQWSPVGRTLLVHPPGPVPGHQDDGWEAMPCTEDIPVDPVMQAVRTALEGIR